jgi:AcrR family transcriptional regulator
VINAAIRTFGQEGYERTSTRALVGRAGTNLVAIHYHFGSKKAVYRAAARHIAAAIRERNREIIERSRLVAGRPDASRAELVEGVCSLFDDYAALALSGRMPECWRRFLMREQAEPSGTGAFELIFSAVRPFFDTAFLLIGRLIDRPPTHPDVRLLALMIFGQMSVFRTNRAAALRFMGWRTLGPRELGRIRRTARMHIHRLFNGGGETRPARRKPLQRSDQSRTMGPNQTGRTREVWDETSATRRGGRRCSPR